MIRISRDSPNPIWRLRSNPGRETMFMVGLTFVCYIE
jgi:hypothetical protein